MSPRRCGALACLVTVTSAFLSAPPVAAEEGARASAGWWSRSPAQSAPQEGFAVASAPDGPVTVAAIVVEVSGAVTSGTVSAVEVGGLGQQAALIVVCPAAAPVPLSEDGGDLDDAPQADCGRGAAPFERNSDSLRWSADLTDFAEGLRDGGSLVILPAPSEAPVQPTFEVRFAAPEVDLRTGAPEGVPDQSGSSPAPGPTADPTPRTTPVTFGSGPAPDPPAPSPLFELDAVDPVEESAAPSPAVMPEITEDEVREAASSPVRATAGISAGSGPQFGKAVGFVVLSALAGACVTATGRLASRRKLRH